MPEIDTASRPLRIALLTHSVNPRGGVVHTLELAQALHDAGQQVTVMAPAAAGQRLFRELPCAVRLLPVPPAPRDVAQLVAGRIDACAEALRAGTDAREFDIWHAQDSITGNVLATLREGGWLPGFSRTVHHLDDFADPRLRHWQQRAFDQATQVLCVSPVWQQALRRDHGVAAGLVDNGVDLRRYSPHRQRGDEAVARRLGLRPRAPLLLAVGGIEARKNSVRLLQAFIAVKRRHPAAQLVVAGGASLLDHDECQRQFHHHLAASGLPPDDVRLTGPLPDAEMPALFRLADVLLMPSLREGFGLVVLEALASGTPVVVSRIEPFTGYLQDTAQATWADPLRPDSIASAACEALALPAFEVPPSVCLAHGWAHSARQHLAHYRRALGRASAPRRAERPPAKSTTTTPTTAASRGVAHAAHEAGGAHAASDVRHPDPALTS